MFEDGQLGSTNVVTHAINTGECIPIKQPARHIPFALRRKVEELRRKVVELVDDVLQKQVIHPRVDTHSVMNVQVSTKCISRCHYLAGTTGKGWSLSCP